MFTVEHGVLIVRAEDSEAAHEGWDPSTSHVTDVRSQVFYRTPLGRRYVDFQFRAGGKTYIVEVKSGRARYSLLQRGKDAWIAKTYGVQRLMVRV